LVRKIKEYQKCNFNKFKAYDPATELIKW